MKKYKYVEVSETQLEDLIRQGAELIEEGLVFVDHQRMTDRGPLDVLLVDSGGALIVAELKVSEDDAMLMQALDYYDWVVRHVEAFSRLYKKHNINAAEAPRLFLIAPSFSISLLNRCKWIDVPLSLFTFQCIQLEGEKDIIPVFSEQEIPAAPETVETYTLEDRLNWITDKEVRTRAKKVLDEIQSWEPKRINLDALKYDVSCKISGLVFAYFCPRRKYFMFYTNDNDGKWTGFRIDSDEDLPPVMDLIKMNVEGIGNITISGDNTGSTKDIRG